MATKDGIGAAFRLLKAAGIRTPEAWSTPEAKREAIDVWVSTLADVSDEELTGAARAYLRQPSPWWPTPGALLALLPSRQVEALDTADIAWALVRHEMARHGRDYPPGGPDWRGRPWDFPADQRGPIHAGIAAVGGWRALSMVEDDDPAPRASFRSAYRSVREGRRIVGEGAAVGLLDERSVRDYDRRIGDWLSSGGGRRLLEQHEEGEA